MIPDITYGLIPGTYDKYGLVELPKALLPRCADEERRTGLHENPVSSGVELTKKGEAYVAAAMTEAGGVFFLTVDKGDRTSIATSIEKLINMLDELDPDPDLEPTADAEPSLGWPDRGPSQLASDVPQDDREADTSDDEPWLGAPETRFGGGDYYYLNGSICPSVPPLSSQESWAKGQHDDREEECEDEGACIQSKPHDESMWQEEGSQERLMWSRDESDLGSTEHIDQTKSCLVDDNPGNVSDGEPELGWTGHGIGCSENEPRDDREGDDERECDLADTRTDVEGDPAYYDEPGTIMGGGSVSQPQDGWKPAPGPDRPASLVEQATVLPSGDIAREIIDTRNAARRRNAKPVQEQVRIPQINARALAASDFKRLPWA